MKRILSTVLAAVMLVAMVAAYVAVPVSAENINLIVDPCATDNQMACVNFDGNGVVLDVKKSWDPDTWAAGGVALEPNLTNVNVDRHNGGTGFIHLNIEAEVPFRVTMLDHGSGMDKWISFASEFFNVMFPEGFAFSTPETPKKGELIKDYDFFPAGTYKCVVFLGGVYEWKHNNDEAGWDPQNANLTAFYIEGRDVGKITINQFVLSAAEDYNEDYISIDRYSDGFYYVIANGEAIVTGYDGKATELTVPDTLGGYPVTAIGDGAFYGRDALVNVTLPDSVTSIGSYAFYLCGSLENVTIPSGVTAIGERAFAYCGHLEAVTLPDGLTAIGDFAFYECGSLKNVTIPSGVTAIGNEAFHGCGSLESIELPDSLTAIGHYAFNECLSLVSITLPDSLTAIGYNAFNYCVSLERVVLPASIERIEEGAFISCYSLKNVYYRGNKTQWAAVTVEGGNGYLTTANMHYKVAGTVEEHLELVSVQQEAGCDWVGWATYTCACDHTVSQSIPAKGHNYQKTVTVVAACNRIGYDEYECDGCGGIYRETLQKVPHTFCNNVCVNGCGLAVDVCLATAHKYINYADEEWLVCQPNANSVTLTFSAETETEDGYDFVYLYDKDETLVGTYTGKELAGQRVTVAGDTVRIHFTSDDAMTYYGFAVTDVSTDAAPHRVGDVNGDQTIDMLDAFAVYTKVSTGAAVGDLVGVADMNGDGMVDMIDAFAIYRIASGA